MKIDTELFLYYSKQLHAVQIRHSFSNSPHDTSGLKYWKKPCAAISRWDLSVCQSVNSKFVASSLLVSKVSCFYTRQF